MCACVRACVRVYTYIRTYIHGYIGGQYLGNGDDGGGGGGGDGGGGDGGGGGGGVRVRRWRRVTSVPLLSDRAIEKFPRFFARGKPSGAG